MKDDQLLNMLRKLPLPLGSASVRARAWHRASIAFEQRSAASLRQDTRKAHGWYWNSGMGFAVLVTLVLLFLPQTRIFKNHHGIESLAEDQQILQQTEMLFPNQVDSIIVKNGKAEVSLAQTPLVGSDQPIVVIFRKDSESIRVLSYSGHHVCITLGHEPHCFDILATPAGGVILENDTKAWLVSEHPVLSGYTVQARTLVASL